MRQKSLFGTIIGIVNLAVVLLAAYLAIDALDQSRRQSARTEQVLGRLADTIDRQSSRTELTMTRFSDAIDRQSGRNEQTMQQLADAIDRIGTRASIDPAAPRAARDTPSAPGQQTFASVDTFANDDLRDPDEEEGGMLVTRTISLPGNLNTLVNNDSTVGTLWSLLVDSLADRNSNDLTRYEPVMAEGWDVSEDGLVYTIRLRKNAMWQPYTDPVTKRDMPAKPVTSGDFLFFWNTIQNTQIPCEHLRTYYEDLDGIEVIDDHTFRVTWKQPYSMSESFTLGLQPLPEHYYRPDPSWDDDKFAEEFISSPRNQWIVGTGPYKLVVWDKNKEVVMERDDSYFGRKPPIKTRHIRLIPDHSTSFLEFKSEKIDVYGLQPTQWHEETPEPDFRLVTPNIETANADSLEWDRRKKEGDLPENYKFEKFQYNSQSWSYVGYNLQRPLFQDREVRVALTHLIDRQRILDEVHLGLGEIISGPFIPQSPYYNHNVKPIPFDVDKAKEILAQAGWEDTDGDGLIDKEYDDSGKRKPFQFTFMIPSSSTTSRKTAAIIERDMFKAGIKVDIKPIEWSVYTQLLEKREYDVCSLGWVGGVEGDPYQIWHGSGANKSGSSNHVGYDSAEANRLIELGRRTVDKQKRYEIYHQLHEVIANDQPYTFLVAPTSTMAQSKRFQNALVYKSGQMNSLLQWIPRAQQQVR